MILVGELSLAEGVALGFGVAHAAVPVLVPDFIAETPYPPGFHRLFVFLMGVGTVYALAYPSRLLCGALAVAYLGSAVEELRGRVRWNLLGDSPALHVGLAALDLATAAVLIGQLT